MKLNFLTIGDVFGNIGHAKGGAIEEAQCAHDLVDGLRLQPTRTQMQPVLADMLEGEFVCRALECRLKFFTERM